MRKISSLGLLLTIVLLLFASNAIAQTLWGGTVYGMSPEEVLKTVEGAKRVEDGTRLHTGSIVLVRAEDVKIVHEYFNVEFFFLNDGLRQVWVTLRDEPPFSSAMSVFGKLTEALRFKYGKELNRESNDYGSARIEEVTWKSGKTNIHLFAEHVGDNPAMLRLTYQMRLEAEKL